MSNVGAVITFIIAITAVGGSVYLSDLHKSTTVVADDYEVSGAESALVYTYSKKVISLPDSSEKDAYLDYLKLAVEDEVIMATEFSEIERLADDAYKAGYASEIKTLTNETPLTPTSQP